MLQAQGKQNGSVVFCENVSATAPSVTLNETFVTCRLVMNFDGGDKGNTTTHLEPQATAS